MVEQIQTPQLEVVESNQATIPSAPGTEHPVDGWDTAERPYNVPPAPVTPDLAQAKPVEPGHYAHTAYSIKD